MKNKFCVLILFVVILVLSAEAKDNKVDVDFSKLNSMVAYSGLFDMMIHPEQYLGKTIRIKGQYDSAQDPDTGTTFFGVVVMDASMCCATGLDFVLKDKYKYPDDYPELGAVVTVTGKFERYVEGEDTYYHLTNADLLKQ